MGLGETSLTWRFSFLLMFIGLFAMIAAVASSYMAASDVIPNRERHIGFWDMCDDTLTYGCKDMTEYLHRLGRNFDWVHACRALVIIGIIIEAISMLISLYMAYMVSGTHLGNLITAGANCLSVVFILIGGLVFLVNAMEVLETTLEMDSDPSWSFALLILAQGFYLIAAGLLIFDACRSN
ncbi:hypothetical protein BgiMline_035429 [Biomphalaria glabrata]|uniref:Uncharacterized protein LOC106073646 n=1 Tax=Biomphalaria glabrata TaxID=6526 RepID=A0A9U8EJ14_BIOGL|nr:uncharacterized protein LOC106073646 [Biomphalaria glabrata]KAI8764349.1 hypothetical protein BgiBS90_029734 [Biomphalaria glabrata]